MIQGGYVIVHYMLELCNQEHVHPFLWDDNAVFIDIYFKIYIHFFQFDPIIDGAI